MGRRAQGPRRKKNVEQVRYGSCPVIAPGAMGLHQDTSTVPRKSIKAVSAAHESASP